MNTIIKSVIFLAGLYLVAITSYAEPVAKPADSWTNYDLIAKVRILAVHTNQEVQYFTSSRGSSYGYLVDIKVNEALRMPTAMDKNQIQLVAPAYSEYGDKKIELYFYSKGEFQVGNQRAIACSYYRRTGTWLVVDWILEEEKWEEYQSQKERGAAGDESDDDAFKQNAAELSREYIRQRRNGEITWEEYNNKMAPIREYYDRKLKLDELQEMP